MQDIQTQPQRPMIGRLFGLIFARLLSPLVSFLIIVLIARAWGETNLGQYMTVVAWLAIFQGLSMFGLAEYTSREVGKDPTRAAKYMTHSLVIGFTFSLVCIVLMAGGAILLRYHEEVRYPMMAASLALPSTACVVICQAVFTAFQKIRYIAIASLLENLFLLLTGSVVIFKGLGLMSLIWCVVTARLLAAAFNLFLSHRYVVRLRFQADLQFLLKLLPPVVVFGLTGLASQVYLRVDVIMLSKMKDMVTVGLYSSASKLMEICLMLPVAFYVLNLPVTARFYKNFRELARQKIEGYTGELLILVFFIFGFTTFFAEHILVSFYGQSFVEAAWVFRILMLSFLIQSGEIVLGMACQAAGHQKVVLYIVTLRAVINVLLNIVLIIKWGMIGAASATLFSIALSFLFFQNFVKKNLDGFRWIRISMKPASVCLITVVLLFPFSGHLNPVFTSLIFCLLYSFALFALNGFSVGRVLCVGSRTDGNL